MGRRWRHHHHHRGKTARSSADAAAAPPSTWSAHQHRDALQQYLRDYRDGARAAHLGHRSPRPEADGDEAGEVRIIGGVVLPTLTDAVCRKPFLEFPLLSSKQRRLVHESCIEVGLFHGSFGPSRDSRRVVVSIFADGLGIYTGNGSDESDASDEAKPTESQPRMYTYSPWYCRNHLPNDTKLNSVEKEFRNQISELQEQPEKCFSDPLDVVESQLSSCPKDLSKVSLPSASRSDIVLVDSAEKMEACALQLRQSRPTEIGFDLECYNQSKYAQVCCLLQITCDTLPTDFIIDTLAPGVWRHVSLLSPLFADPSIVKVGHAIGGLDVPSLHRDFGIFCVNAFDTHEAAKLLKLAGTGLADVCQYYGLQQPERYKRLKEAHQACDWRARPLTASMVEYAGYDVHFLLPLRKLMMRDLILVDTAAPNSIDASSSKRVAGGESNGESPKKSRSLLALFRSKTSTKHEEKNDTETSSTLLPQETAKVTQPKKTSNYRVTFEGRDTQEYSPVKVLLDNKLKGAADTDDDLFFMTPNKPAMHSTPASTKSGKFFTPFEKSPPGTLTEEAEVSQRYPTLLQVIARSQLYSKSFFTFAKEPHSQNDFFVSLLQRAAKKEIDWNSDNVRLYAQLAAWRTDAAAKLGCLPGFVASLQFLAGVAWKRPQSLEGLKRIASDFPDALEDHESLCREMLAIVRDSYPARGSESIYYFGKKHRPAGQVELLRNTAVSVAICAAIAGFMLYGGKLHQKFGH